jgi:hypothetical protein
MAERSIILSLPDEQGKTFGCCGAKCWPYPWEVWARDRVERGGRWGGGEGRWQKTILLRSHQRIAERKYETKYSALSLWFKIKIVSNDKNRR